MTLPRWVANGKITETFLGYAQGTITAIITVEGDDFSQGFGMYRLSGARCALFVDRMLSIAGVDRWERLVGQLVRVSRDVNRIHALGHIINDNWFNLADEFGSAKEGQE